MQTDNLEYSFNASKPFAQEIAQRSGQDLASCYQCRRCASGCPVGDETEGVTPDRLIRMILLGDIEGAKKNLLIWKCVACYTCGTRCPNNIQTSRINEALKHLSKEEASEPLVPSVALFHDAFMKSVSRGGRFNELEFMAIYEMGNMTDKLRHGRIKAVVDEMRNSAKLGFSMLRKKRLHLSLQRIKNKEEIAGLFKKAKGHKGVK